MGYEDKLRRLCASNGLTYQELGQRAGLKRSTISRILGGQQPPKLMEAYELARALGVSLDYLVSESTEAHPAARLVEVTEDEMTLLTTARILGVDVALRRILNAPPVAAPPPTPPRPDSSTDRDRR